MLSIFLQQEVTPEGEEEGAGEEGVEEGEKGKEREGEGKREKERERKRKNIGI